MPVQINKEDFAKPWKPGIYPKSTTVIYDNQLWILNDTITGLFTSSDFLTEVANGDWIGRYTTEDDLSTKEDLVNKATDFTTINDTLYPSVKAVKDYVDANAGGIPFDIIKDYPNQILMSAAGNAMNYFGTYAQTFTGTQSDLLIGGGGISYRKVVSAASAGSNANFYDAGIYRVTGTKGFYYRARIKNEDSVNIPTGRFSYGFSGTAIMGNINPSTYTQPLLSFGADNTDTNCQIMYKLNLGATTKINLGATMPKTQLDEYVIEFWRLNGTTTINYRITNLTTSVVVSGSFVFAFAGLALGHFRNNETVASSCGFAIRRVELYISD